MGYLRPWLVALVVVSASVRAAPARTLSFDDRVAAQEAIERVSYSHQIGATQPFTQAVSREVLVKKVQRSLQLSAALDAYWHTPVTDKMLTHELARMASGTKMPGRLVELYAALGNDPFLIKECLARPVLADRLARNFYANDPSRRATDRWDDWWDATKDSLAIDGVMPVAKPDSTLALPSKPFAASTLTCATDNTWDNASLGEVPDSRYLHTAVWTGSEMIIWSGTRQGAAFGIDFLDTGARYDPATDNWTPTSLTGAPAGRQNHTAVWTGTEMIVWGGGDATTGLQSGGRYNPLSDSWTPTSLTGTPLPRGGHKAIWTGSLMIVWGGQPSNTGGRYNPATNSWALTTTVGAPTLRESNSLIWTGTEMIVWGGWIFGQTPTFRDGGRYNPVTNIWIPTTLVGAPPGRYGHSAVWTGTRMVVYGGSSASGGQYDPATDSWTPIATAGAPGARIDQGTVWTGREMLIWGGQSASALNTGARYDPDNDLWTPMTVAGAPAKRYFHSAIWTGTLMIVWGGGDSVTVGSFDTGGRYDPSSDSWTPTAASPSPPARHRHTAVWTGNQMIMWGGADTLGTLGGGARYDPVTDSWSATSLAGAPSGRERHTAVWVGSKMIVWGGLSAGGPLGDGARYDPIADAWTPVSGTNAPSPRPGHLAVGTGNRMIVWGGGGLTTGGRYDPVLDTWAPTATAGAPPNSLGTAVWTGTEMIVWGGDADAVYLNVGGRYNPVTDVWLSTSTTGAPTVRNRHSAAWAGGRMVIWGGYGLSVDSGEIESLRDGGRYDPATDTWTQVSSIGAPSARFRPTALTTGSRVVIWGGANDTTALRTGGRYDPATDTWLPTSLGIGVPYLRSGHSAVWTGDAMIVWGGKGNASYLRSGGRYMLGASEDHDGDGASICQGDCDDTTPSSHSDFDHDGEGDACDFNDGLIYVLGGGKNDRSWQAESGFTSWNSYRGSLTVLRASGEYTQGPGSNPLAARDCGLATTTIVDPLVPGPGEVAFHLVTGVAGGIEGSLGTDSAGTPRANAHPCP